MPNWVENIAIIMGAEEDLKAIEDCKMSFQKLVPRPEDEKNWYEWNIDNWGTRGDIVADDGETNAYKFERNEDGHIETEFNTAWYPPREFFCHLTEKMDGLRVLLRYLEEGDDFWGEALFWNGRMYEKEIEDKTAFIREHFWEEYGMYNEDEDDDEDEDEDEEQKVIEEKTEKLDEKNVWKNMNEEARGYDLDRRQMIYKGVVRNIKQHIFDNNGISFDKIIASESELAEKLKLFIRTMKEALMLE